MKIFVPVLLLGFYDQLMDWLAAHLLRCPFKQMFLIDCPGCGLQRSFVALLRGDVSQSWRLYPAMLPILFLVIFTGLHLRFQFRQGAFIIKLFYIFISLVIFINYIVKIKTHQLL